ncbi:MAG TPA: hypothetical protein PK388_02810 [Kiritimatiellia bacterium]|nr:hypothetical protein [Kiritimatiellia bacterium]
MGRRIASNLLFEMRETACNPDAAQNLKYLILQTAVPGIGIDLEFSGMRQRIVIHIYQNFRLDEISPCKAYAREVVSV